MNIPTHCQQISQMFYLVLELVDCAAFYRPCLSLACSHKAGGNHFFQKSHDMFPVYWQCQTKRPTCIQSAQYMQLVQFQNILGMDPPEVVCVSVCVCLSVCGVGCVCVCACHNEYVCTMPTFSAHIHLSSELQCSTHVPFGPIQIAAYPPILPQPQSRTSRQQTGTLHLLEKPEARYHSTPCSQYITVYHNVPQCA